MCRAKVDAAEVESLILEAVRGHGGLPALAAYRLLQEKEICLKHFWKGVQALAKTGLLTSSDPAHPIEANLPPARILELGLEAAPEGTRAERGVRHLQGGIDVFLEKRLGRGAFGDVYLGEQVRFKRPVAVKIINLGSLPSFAIREWYVDHFRREPRILASLNHPHIVHVRDWGQEGDDLWYAMELLEGGTLSDRITKDGRLPPKEILVYFKAVTKALLEASLLGVLHRDVKPGNIFNAGPKVADFGIAKLLGERGGTRALGGSTPIAAIIGSPPYIAPERANFQSGDLRSDIYSLGATMYHAATGRLLFKLDAGDRKGWYHHHLHEKPRPLFYSVPDFPIGLGEVIHKCLAKDPADRFRTFEALLKQLGD